MQNTNNFVFFNAIDASVAVSVNQQHVGAADTVEGLVEVLLRANVNTSDRFAHSSDVDFASEEGFATDNCAHELIEAALEDAGLV